MAQKITFKGNGPLTMDLERLVNLRYSELVRDLQKEVRRRMTCFVKANDGKVLLSDLDVNVIGFCEFIPKTVVFVNARKKLPSYDTVYEKVYGTAGCTKAFAIRLGIENLNKVLIGEGAEVTVLKELIKSNCEYHKNNARFTFTITESK